MKYILEYQIPVPNNEGRYFALSACEKAKYIYNNINNLGVNIEIISASYAKKNVYSRIDKINDKTILISGFSLGWTNKFTKIISRVSSMLWLLFYLLFKCNRGETILIYHGVQNIPIYIFAQWIKKFKYILEVEEVYSMLDLNTGSGWRYKLELEMIQRAERYIFASQQLEQMCNVKKKPFVICSGAYTVPPKLSSQIEDGKIHIVYAGLIANEKVAFKSAQIAKFLNESYHIHIIGYGTDEDINQLELFLDKINRKSKCRVTYDGLKTGNDYFSFLQSCHIGLCPITTNLSFQNACFPSKITSYLSNGLLVLTTKNDVLESSVYSDYLFFVKDDKPEHFANVILDIDIRKFDDPRKCVLLEHSRVMKELANII